MGVMMPSVEILVIIAFASTLPILFFLWIKWWLAQPDSNEAHPDQVEKEQAKADQEHLAHSGGHGHGHGHGHAAHAHGHGHGHGHH